MTSPIIARVNPAIGIARRARHLLGAAERLSVGLYEFTKTRTYYVGDAAPPTGPAAE